MIYRQLGKTGLKVSQIGFGASPLGAEFGAIDPEEGRRSVNCAIENGINYFDVAPYYGRTLAEKRLGEFLKGKRDQVVLATKACRYDIDGFLYTEKRIMQSIDESLERLRTDYIDIYQIHDIEHAERKQIFSETIPAMLKLKERGKVRFVGITGYPLTVLKEIAEGADIATILTYCRYNLLDTSMDEILTPMAKEKGIGLINASPLHMRALTEKGAPDWHPAPPKVYEAITRAVAFCSERGVNIADIAMQFALAHEDVAVTLVGMSKVRHVESNVKIVGIPPDEEILKGVLEIFKPVSNVCWKEGLPENDDPGAIEKSTLGLERNEDMKKQTPGA